MWSSLVDKGHHGQPREHSVKQCGLQCTNHSGWNRTIHSGVSFFMLACHHRPHCLMKTSSIHKRLDLLYKWPHRATNFITNKNAVCWIDAIISLLFKEKLFSQDLLVSLLTPQPNVSLKAWTTVVQILLAWSEASLARCPAHLPEKKICLSRTETIQKSIFEMLEIQFIYRGYFVILWFCE